MERNNTIYYKIAVVCFILGFITSFLLFGIPEHYLQKKYYRTDRNNKQPPEPDQHDHGSVILNDDEIKELGIIIKQAGSGTIQLHTDLVGEIKPDPTRIAHIVPRFTGIVKEVRKSIGDKVKKNEVIAVIESNESLTRYKVVSLIEGTVIDIHMTPGELTGENTSQKIIVADLSRVWAELRVYQNDLPFIRKGQMAKISADNGRIECEGHIMWVSPVVDVTTRTTAAWILLENKTGMWKPGMFITATVLTMKKKVNLAVEKNALQVLEGQTVVFTRDRDTFHPQPVTVGLQDKLSVEILSGLYEGQKYAAQGAFTIKAELTKESFSEGHAH